jgi:ubiquinone/menaquinone biosynthesis C-methylase UbiE
LGSSPLFCVRIALAARSPLSFTSRGGAQGGMIADMGHPIFAAVYDRALARAEHAGFADRRGRLLAGLRGDVLEIGAGTGLNLAHYPASVTRLVLAEPDPHMAGRLRDRIAAQPPVVAAEVIEAPAEVLPFADASFDAVVSTLVLCTVDSPERAAAEIARVLRPDGRVALIEHVRDPGSGARARFQDLLERPWGWVAGSCHPNRNTLATLTAAGFDTSAVEAGEFDAAGPLVKPLIVGSAVAPRK